MVMDGNGRWANERGLTRTEGHRAGESAVHTVIRRAGQRGVEVVTLFAFSSENWRRPPDEVKHLMGLFVRALGELVDELDKNGVRLLFIRELRALARGVLSGMA